MTYHASWPGSISTLIGSNYRFLEQIFIVQKVFEPLKVDYTYLYSLYIYIYILVGWLVVLGLAAL